MAKGRMAWLDVTKGWAILWVVYFHSFTCWIKPPSPIGSDFITGVIRPDTWTGLIPFLSSIGRSIFIGVSMLGFHAVGLFLVASGFVLAQSATRAAEKSGGVAWGSWILQRLVRLYPMYWFAHLIYLISPFEARLEPVDWRFWVSLSGLRFLWIDYNFFYLNAAWWYFCLIIQLFAFFPILMAGLRKWGPIPFLVVAVVAGFFARVYLLYIHPSSGQWVLGGCGLSRLPEFAFGMVLGSWFAKHPDSFENWLLRGRGFLTGLCLYPVALLVYQLPRGYVAVDFLTGIACFLVVAGASGFWSKIPYLGQGLALAGSFSYGIYLVHQPYAIHFASRLKDQSAWIAVPSLLLIATGLAVWGGCLEKILTRWLTPPVAPKSISP
ncbi:MAG: acyltransferase [Candidatus Pacebacteria bacterium]|nr:acyltransferase [Candidatus Paceibacterota bacterium]